MGKKRFDELGEAANVARIYVGGHRAGGSERVPRDAIAKALEVAAQHAGGAATVFKARGNWRSPDTGIVYKEPTTVVEIVGSGAISCERFHSRAKGIAARAARIADQEGVLAVSMCSSGRVEADVIDRRGRVQNRLLKLPEVPRTELQREPRMKAVAGHRTTRNRKRRTR